MATVLLNPWALDVDGKYVSVEHGIKGHPYTCPKCGERLTFCKQGDGPRFKRAHFKHERGSKCHGYTPHESESAIHEFAKHAVYNILRERIDQQLEFNITWECPDCHEKVTANLLQDAKDVHEEKDLGSARPDVSLFDANGKAFIAIEIVFTHDVEQKTMRFYDTTRMVVIRIKVHSAEDCNDMEQKLHYPDSVNVICRQCHLKRMQRQYVITQQPAKPQRIVNPYGTGIEREEAQQRRYIAIRRNYAIRANKKSGGNNGRRRK